MSKFVKNTGTEKQEGSVSVPKLGIDFHPRPKNEPEPENEPRFKAKKRERVAEECRPSGLTAPPLPPPPPKYRVSARFQMVSFGI